VEKYNAFPYLLFLKHIALSLKNKVLSFTKTKEFHRLMNVKIGAEAALFPEKKYISGIFVAV
jgi:hypothetical protein